MKVSVKHVVAAVVAMIFCLRCGAQTTDQVPTTLHIDSALTLVDVIAENTKAGPHTRELLTDLHMGDFHIFDNGHEMPIQSFDIGAQSTTRPVTLWLIVQCNQDEPPGHHSMFMQGKTQLLKPALAHLGKDDAVGVAHWCDSGDSMIDLAPGHDTDAALTKIETILHQEPILGINRTGELAMQRMIRMILDDTHQTRPSRLPVFLFLYGDACATYVQEANSISKELLETSGIVFGMNDGSWPYLPPEKFPLIGSEVDTQKRQIYYLVHYYSRETGGDVYSAADPKLFSAALDYILTQLHSRYTLGFTPEKLDGKRHILKVELTDDAEKRFPLAQLRFRPQYIPTAH